MTSPVETAELIEENVGAVTVLRLNRPRRRNALTADLIDAVHHALLRAEQNSAVRSVVLTGNGGAFSAGADIKSDSLGAKILLEDHYNPLITTMVTSDLPIVAAVDGVAAGAGASVALACDFRVASPTAYFQLSFVKLGLAPDAGLTWLLPRLVGGARAAQLALLGSDLPAREALSWGLVTRISEADGHLEDALALAHELAATSSSVGDIKRALRRGADAELADQLQYEADLQTGLQKRPDFGEAIQAFREKRAPEFPPRTVTDRATRPGGDDAMTNHLIEVEDGVSIYAQDVGTGRPVVLLHGWALGHEVWDRQVHDLVTSGRRAIAIDLRGHGHSSQPFDGYDVDRLASDVIGVLESLELEQVTLVGWSLGGLTGFRAAIRRPDLITKLVLVCSNGVAASRQPGLPFGAAAADVQDAVLAAELADRVASRESQIRTTVRKNLSETTIQWLISLTMRVPSWAGRGCLTTVMNTDQVDDADKLAVPLVQILGEADPILSKRAAAWLMDHVPDASQIRIPDSGHFPMFENPEPFAEALMTAVSSENGHAG